MRHLAMTGMVTASWISWILSGSDIRATPPSRRMSAGTRSSAMTAHAPASSAIFACSASTTSMITPPLSISARPLLTRIVPYSAIGLSVAGRDLIEPPRGAVVAGAGGTLRRARNRELRPPRQPPRRPPCPPAVGLCPARLRRRAAATVSVALPDPGHDGPGRHVAEPHRLPPEHAREHRPALRGGGLPARARRRRGRVDVVRRLAVHRLAGNGALRRVPLRRGRLLRRLPLSDARRGRSPWPHRQVERRLRRDGRADAAARRLRRAGYARRRRTLRALLHAGVPRDDAGTPRRVRRLVRAVLGGLPLATGTDEEVRHLARQHLRDGRVLLGERGRLDRPPLRHRHRHAAGRRVAALARVGSGPDGAPTCRRAARPARDLHRRRQARRVLPRPGCRRVPARARGARDHGRLLRAFRRRPRRDRVPVPDRDPLPRRAPPVTTLRTGLGRTLAQANAPPPTSAVALRQAFATLAAMPWLTTSALSR